MRGGFLWLGILVLAAQGARAQAIASTVALTLTPPEPVKGRDAEAALEIAIGGVDQPAPPVLRANVGSIDRMERIGPGRFRARYVLPLSRSPEVAIIVAFAPWPHPQSVEGAFGVLRVPIASAVEVPGRAEPGAEVRLMLAGKTFGPVKAGGDGSFRLPVVVPPGYGLARTFTVDRVGNRRTAQLDLALPRVDQLACVVTPTSLPADGASRARVLCASSDKYGAPTRGAKVQWKYGRGTWSAPRELGDGVQEWTWTAPRELGSGAERMIATWKQGGVDSSEEIAVGLSQGPARRLDVQPEDLVAHAGSTWRLVATARDQLGRPLAGVALSAPGCQPVSTGENGEALLTWLVPANEPLGPRVVVVKASGPIGREPARLVAWRTADGVSAQVVDLAGLPVPGQRLLCGTTSLVTGSDGSVSVPRGAGAELVHAEWPGLRLALEKDVAALPSEVGAQVSMTVAPALPVNVKIVRARADFEWWVERADGTIVDGREVEIRSANAARRVTSKGKSREAYAPGLVSITDLGSRVSAVIEATP